MPLPLDCAAFQHLADNQTWKQTFPAFLRGSTPLHLRSSQGSTFSQNPHWICHRLFSGLIMAGPPPPLPPPLQSRVCGPQFTFCSTVISCVVPAVSPHPRNLMQFCSLAIWSFLYINNTKAKALGIIGVEDVKVETAWNVSFSLFRAKVIVIPKDQRTRVWMHRVGVKRMGRSEGSPISDSKT